MKTPNTVHLRGKQNSTILRAARYTVSGGGGGGGGVLGFLTVHRKKRRWWHGIRGVTVFGGTVFGVFTVCIEFQKV